ncbi:MAG: bifunctional oligoribonuclease/PAP phosphatase NrnA [Ignavibacteria bacterium]|nr:bifunctional oligoribonuclease/PAP phosphatase NrnA [Ignavibacteria bacterium]
MVNKEIVSLINNNQEFILTSHVNPDGDSIGSEIALQKYLSSLGKSAKVLNYSPTPANYTFLDSDNVIEQFNEVHHKNLIENTDVIFVLDTNEYSRLRTLEPFIKSSKAKKILIDHHLGYDPVSGLFDSYIVDTDSPATGEMLYKFFKNIAEDSSQDIKDIVTRDMAVALYAAIMTDTGSFKFNRTDSETHDIISELLSYGLNPYDIYSEIYNRATLGKLHLLGRFLNKITMIYEGKAAYSVVSQSDFEETQTDEYAIEGFSSHLMSLETVELGIVITETKRGVKLSFRSKGNVRSNELAGEFQGGGHMNASGAFVPGAKLESIVKEVISKAEKYLK